MHEKIAELQKYRSFVANRDVVDSLKLEASVASPTEHREFIDMARGFLDVIEDEYGHYMSLLVKRRLKKLPERLIQTNSKVGIIASDEWLIPGGDFAGKHLPIGDIILIQQPKEHKFTWNRLRKTNMLPKEYQKGAKPMQRFINERYKQVIIHELLHAASAHQIWRKTDFNEFAVCYYTDQIAKKVNSTPCEEKAETELFTNFLTTINPEKVHRVYFGHGIRSRNVDDETRSEIHEVINAFTEFCQSNESYRNLSKAIYEGGN